MLPHRIRRSGAPPLPPLHSLRKADPARRAPRESLRAPFHRLGPAPAGLGPGGLEGAAADPGAGVCDGDAGGGAHYRQRRAGEGIRRANDTITVTGASTERIRSDHADWTVELSQSGPSQQASYGGLLPALATTRAFLEKEGIQPQAMQSGAVKTERQEVRDPRTGELRSTSWTSRQEIRISSPEVDRIAAIASRIGQLIGQGVPLTINEPAYTYTQLAGKRVDMLAKATADARRRARAIAAEAGASIGPITNADTGIFQITAPNSTETSGGGTYDTRTIDKDITAVIGVTFRVK